MARGDAALEEEAVRVDVGPDADLRTRFVRPDGVLKVPEANRSPNNDVEVDDVEYLTLLAESLDPAPRTVVGRVAVLADMFENGAGGVLHGLHVVLAHEVERLADLLPLAHRFDDGREVALAPDDVHLLELLDDLEREAGEPVLCGGVEDLETAASIGEPRLQAVERMLTQTSRQDLARAEQTPGARRT